MPKSKSLLLYNYSLNSQSPVFSHQVDIAKLLTREFNSCTIITGEGGRDSLASNLVTVYTLQTKGNSKIRKYLRLYYYTFKSIRSRPDIVFYHMVDFYAALVAPIFWIFGIRQVLWYAHDKYSLHLKLAGRFMNCVLTSTSNSFPSKATRLRRKMYVIGQGIEIEKFPITWNPTQGNKCGAICVGRLDRSKGIDEILESMATSSISFPHKSITFVGSPSSTTSRVYISEVFKKYSQTETKITLTGNVPRQDLAKLFRNKSFFIHAFRGSLDKVLLEATLCNIPVVTINAEYLKIFGQWSSVQNPSLSIELEAFLKTPLRSVLNKNEKRRLEVIAHHSLAEWSKKITRYLLDD